MDPSAVVEAVRRYGAPLVGLSALMTTTLKSMAETISMLHDAGLTCQIMVGGAVLTPDYARQIQADFYALDAKESVDIAKRLIGQRPQWGREGLSSRPPGLSAPLTGG